MHNIITLVLDWANELGYWGIFILMSIESSFIPFPSEVVIPPAAYLASKGQMDLTMVILSGIGGSLAGAAINYFLAYFLGRPLIYTIAEKKFMRFLLITPHKLDKAEVHFNKYGNIATFLGRLLPGIRQLVSIPAGISKMPLLPFFFYTFLGSGIWVIILAALGYLIGEKEKLIGQYLTQVSLVFIAITVLVSIYFYKRIRRKRGNSR